MNEEIRERLDEEIMGRFSDLSQFSPGSAEMSAAVDDLTKLYKLRIEENSKIADSNIEATAKNDQRKDRYISLGIEAAGVVLPLIFYAFWMKRGFKFEETGSFTSTTFRGLFSRFRPTGKN
jgi:hypothetical protein